MITGQSNLARVALILREYAQETPESLRRLADKCATTADGCASDYIRGLLVERSVILHRAADLRSQALTMRGVQ